TTKQHEFSLAETSTLDDLASWMGIVAIGSIVLGAFDVVGFIFALTRAAPASAIAMPIAGAAWIVVGIWLRLAAESLSAVTRTEGNDITHVLSALAAMRKAYVLQAAFVALNAVAVFALV